jgi:FtsP/CotA-like multicopper oxidase with cupredoxin domain
MEQEIPELEQHRMHSAGHHGSLLHFQHHSAIINGRGRWLMDDAAIPWFKVRFTPGIVLDVVHAGGDFGLKVSVDGHKILVLSLDGFDIEPVEVDMFYIYPGETMEVSLVNTTQDTAPVWIRVKEIMLHEMSPEHDHTIDIPNHVPSNDTPKQAVMNDDMMEMRHIVEPQKQDARSGRAKGASETKRENSMNGQNITLDRIGEATKLEHRFQVGDDKQKRSVDGSHVTDTENTDGNSTDSERGLHSMEGRAILFHGASDADYNGHAPTSTEHDCVAKTCRVFNCPGPSMNQAETCVLLNDIKGKASTNAEFWRKLDLHHDPDETHVINFMLSGHPHASGSTANGKKFLVPDVPMYSKKARKNDCSACEKCGHCTNILTLPAGKVVQLTLANLQSEQPLYMHHPIHLHGYAFGVMKVAYPTFEAGFKPASGIKCLSKFCEEVERSESASETGQGGSGHVHDLGHGQTMNLPHRHQRNTQPAAQYMNSTGLDEGTRLLYKRSGTHTGSAGMEVIMKNTILVPAKGYVDVRIFTNNPGFWFIHCHVDLHLLKGMAALIEVLPQVPPPNDFPTCGNELLPYTIITSKGFSQPMSYQSVATSIITLINLIVHL